MSFPRYPAYKPSGVEWLGEVPEHWEVWKLSHAFTQIGSGTTPKTDNRHYYDGGNIPWVNTGDLNDNVIDKCEKRITALAIAEHPALKIYPAGSVLIAMYGATIGKLAMLNFAATVNQACCVFTGKSEITSEFIFYWFLGLRQQIISLATGGGQPNISQDILRSLRVAIPPLSQQSQIASFLNRETSKIDALIAEQQRLIELLQEKRQAVITHAVTKGLNPDAPMKDSGVEWLGEVPEHWEITKLKRITQQISVGIVVEPSKYYDDEGDVPALRSLNVKPCKIDIEDCVYISRRSNELLAKSILRAGDLVLVRTGQPGNCAVVPESLDGCNCIDLIFARKPHQGCSDYLMYQLSSDAARHQYDLGSDGAIQQHFNVKTATNLIIAWPTDCEQRAISSYLNTTLEKLDDMIKTTFSTVLLLQERRSALISAAVTGQIDVRGLVPEADAA